jgi:endonuclease YncB( thermonuclease family)
VNAELVRQGYAWVYRHYAHDPALYAAEQEARNARRGLWAQGRPLPPWAWREKQRGLSN